MLRDQMKLRYEVVISQSQNSQFYFKGSRDQSHFIFEIDVGKRRIRHLMTLN